MTAPTIHPLMKPFLEKRVKNPRLLARLLDMNRTTQPGDFIRGWHRRVPLNRTSACTPRGYAIRRWGRAAVEGIDRRHIYKSGKRQYVGMMGIISLEYGEPSKRGAGL